MAQHQYDQTDFGGIYHNQPAQSLEPKTTHELAELLAHYHRLGQPVTIRNTGHSVNGQTLTAGVQINLSQLTGVDFDREQMQVTVGAGCTWDSVLKAVNFPEYCLPMFPNNPGQKIHIGGTASVGGVGAYSSKVGGFWNHVTAIKLVTMTGEIITCSRAENYELLKYSLGGYGRIGVIAELTINVVHSKPKLLNIALGLYSYEANLHNIDQAMADPVLSAVVWQMVVHPNPVLDLLGPRHYTFLVSEVDEGDDYRARSLDIFAKYKHFLAMYVGNLTGSSSKVDMDMYLTSKLLTKADGVYFYPTPAREDQLHCLHPWSDYIVDRAHLRDFTDAVIAQVRKYSLEGYLVKEGALHSLIDLPFIPVYVGFGAPKSHADWMPLSLCLPHVPDYAFGVGLMPNIPVDKLADVTAATKYLTDMIYEMNGKRYLYGYHDLTPAQVEKQYGRDIIQRWQELKDKLDPKHLLNIGVIEHLDS